MGRRINRRRFLRNAAEVTVGLAATQFQQVGRGRAQPDYEGVYTDRFTYRRGEPILVHASLAKPKWIDIDLYRHDTPVTIRPERVSKWIPQSGNPDDPGINGAKFDVVHSFDTTDLVEGLYQISIPPSAMLPENQSLDASGFPSDPSVVRFVVTSSTPGSRSRILWIHDSQTGTAYGSYGGRSIYGSGTVKVPTVSYSRPALDRATIFFYALRFFRQHGFEFEYIDVVSLSEAPSGFLDSYDLVLLVGQFEYLPHAFMAHLKGFLDAGGNLFASTWEFGGFRTRLDPVQEQLTTYKFEWEAKDPLYGSGSTDLSGVTMNIPGAIRETEILGQTYWAGYNVADSGWIDLPLYNTDLVQPFLQGTGLGAGASLPSAFRGRGLGNRVSFDGGNPVIAEPEQSGTPGDTIVWAAVPSPVARAWWQADGRPSALWPLLDDGYAIATYQDRPSGSRIVSFPSSQVAHSHTSDPLYQQLLLNILGFLSQP